MSQPYAELYSPHAIARFWSKVEVLTDKQCWNWKGGTIPQGYGSFWANGRNLRAHRVAWELFHNTRVPDGGVLCHHCDNPLCVNPHHLYVGTSKTNAQDREKRGRANRLVGESSPRARITEAVVVEIRARYEPRKVTLLQLADEFGISFQHVSEIVHGKKWAHVK